MYLLADDPSRVQDYWNSGDNCKGDKTGHWRSMGSIASDTWFLHSCRSSKLLLLGAPKSVLLNQGCHLHPVETVRDHLEVELYWSVILLELKVRALLAVIESPSKK